MGSVGVVLQAVGLFWDLSWHRDFGREWALSPPHIPILAGLLIGGVVLAPVACLPLADRRAAAGSDPRRPGGYLRWPPRSAHGRVGSSDVRVRRSRLEPRAEAERMGEPGEVHCSI